MDWIAGVITALGALKPETLAIVIVLMSLFGCGYMHIIWRHEDREDKNKLLDVVSKNSEALGQLRNMLSALSGKEL